MSIAHHPDPATLITCSAGSQPEAQCAVVASHISICPRCAAEFSGMDRIGRVLFGDLPPHPLSRARPEPRPVARPARAQAFAGPSGEVPGTIAAAIGPDLDALAWERLADGIDQVVVEMTPTARGDLRLLRLAAGARLAEHGHSGEELTLVLRGSCRDETGRYDVGDFCERDDETRHAVAATEDGDCILLVASERTPAFAG